MIQHVIMTGANGYIGSRLVEIARSQGRRVAVLTRQPAGEAGAAPRRVAWSLGEPLPAAALDPALPAREQALIHLAHDWRNPPGGGEDGGLNLEGTRALLQSCRGAGLGRFVFVSSQSARADAANIYGRVKWHIEQELADGEVAARVGLVYGGKQQAMFGMLSRLTKLAPALPMIDPWREVQPIHLDEVCLGLLRLADGRQTGWVGLAGPVGMPFGRFLATLAREFHGKRLPILPVPLRAALLACDLSAAVPFGPTVDRERVLGLAGTRPMECAEHLQDLGLAVKPLEAGLRGEPASRKAVLAEGRVLLAFVLGAKPDNALLRRYARAVAAAGSDASSDGPLSLSRALRAAPGLVRFVEPLRPGAPLRRRLALATALAEASPDGERALSRRGRPASLMALAANVALDGFAMPVRLLASLRQR